MDPNSPTPAASVSNLVPVWDEPDGGGSFEPHGAERVVERAVVERAVVERGVRVERLDPPMHREATVDAPHRPRLVAPPETFDAAEQAPRRSAYELLVDELAAQEADVDHGSAHAAWDDELPHVDYDVLRRRDIARELLRARLVALAERRERRSAYEIVFIMLAAAVAVLLAAPPLVQVLLAAHGQQV